ncbi:MAG TPA: hypothetical protein DD416_07545 [Rhodobacteraceae bacterium]|jgi:rod shape-determining protein MreD|nr:hypothetical protein [Paracoccaceae bacterium]
MAAMADSRSATIWLGRLAYLICATLLLFGAMIPLQFTPSTIPRPDVTLCLTLAIVLRRPEFAPVWLVGGIFFLDDILLNRPLGLWTAIAVLSCEGIRSQEYRFRDLIFPFEWVFVAGVMLLALLVNRLILSLSFVPVTGFGFVMLHFFVTVAAYPFVVFFCGYVLRIRKVTPDQAIQFGHRL